MRYMLARLGILTAILVLLGDGCYPFVQSPGGPTDAAQPVNIVQPRPADCGERNPTRLQPHFAIGNPTVVVGEPMQIDASCSVGRIVSLRWDFDTQAWPANTPTEQRFEPEIPVDHVDKTWPTSTQSVVWPLNNFGPFFTIYTPTAPGSRSMRLWATDASGREQVVMATYTVLPDTPDNRTFSTQMPLRPHFIATTHGSNGQNFIVPRYYDKRPVFLPDYLSYQAHAIGATGSITDYYWSFHQIGGTIQDTTSWQNLANSAQGVFTHTITGFLFSHENLVHRNNDTPIRRSYDAEVRLVVNQSQPQMDTYPYTVVSVPDVQTLTPQLSFLPADQFDPTTEPQTGSKISYKGQPPGIFLDPGQTFTLQNFSLPGWYQNGQQKHTGEILIEFDPGTGVYEDVGKFSPHIATLEQGYVVREQERQMQGYLESTFVKKIYQAPTRPGQYQARLRVTEQAAAPYYPIEKKETHMFFEVIGTAQPTPAPNPTPTPSAPAAPTSPTTKHKSTTKPPSLPPMTIEVYPENNHGTRMYNHTEIYQDDNIVFYLHGITADVARVEWDLKSDGTQFTACTNAVIPSGFQCQFKRLVAFRASPGTFTITATAYSKYPPTATDHSDFVAYTAQYTVLRNGRPADKNS